MLLLKWNTKIKVLLHLILVAAYDFTMDVENGIVTQENGGRKAPTEAQIASQFKPGNPGGPGRPRKRPQSEAYDDLLRRKLPPEFAAVLRQFGLPKDATWADAFAAALAREALKGNVIAVKEMREATEGKATQRIELLSHEDKTVEISVTFENAPAPVDPLAVAKPVEKIIDVEVEKSAETKEPKRHLPPGILLDEE